MPEAGPDKKKLLAFARRCVSGISAQSALVELEGGNLNHVWRIRSDSGMTYILKYAPPYVASVPEIALDDSRIEFEGRILRALRSRSEFSQMEAFGVRPPEILGQDSSRHFLLMEDVGIGNNLLQAMQTTDDRVESYAGRLGAYIAELHAQTYKNIWFAERFANLPVQQTRMQVQYNGCLEFCRRGRVPDTEKIGSRCRELGQKFNSIGKCLIMGDLWPYSILMGFKEIRLIDWELTHFGRPAQDVAHLAAHLWMMVHRSTSRTQRDRIKNFRSAFMEGYMTRVAKLKPELITDEDRREFQIHFGAEILARTLGSFQHNYLYDGLEPGHPAIQEAAAEARKWICGEYEAFKP